MTKIRKTVNRRQHTSCIKIGPVEEALVRTIHRKVGGPSKLSTYDDPADVRTAVLRALVTEQPSSSERDRIKSGNLTSLERRVVRIVTNRGAAVRSRARQRKEMQRLREELACKNAHIRKLERQLAAFCKKGDIAGVPATAPKMEREPQSAVAKEEQKLQSEDTEILSDEYGMGLSGADEPLYSSASSISSPTLTPANCYSVMYSLDSLPNIAVTAAFKGCENMSLDSNMFSKIIDPLS